MAVDDYIIIGVNIFFWSGIAMYIMHYISRKEGR